MPTEAIDNGSDQNSPIIMKTNQVSSPQVSPSFASLSDLSPSELNPLRGLSNLALPNSNQVFGSPQPNPKPPTSMRNRIQTSAADSNVCGQHESHSSLEQPPYSENQVLSCSPSTTYLVDPAEMVESPNLCRQLGNATGEDPDGGSKQENRVSDSFMEQVNDIFQSFESAGPSSGGQQSQSLSKENEDSIEQWIKALDSFPDPPWTVEGCENQNKGQVEETNEQSRGGSPRHLQFSVAPECQIASISDIEDPNSMGTTSTFPPCTMAELENLASFQNNSRLTCCSQPLNAFSNPLSSETYFSHLNSITSNQNNTHTFTPGIGLHLNKFGHGVVSISPGLTNINTAESIDMQVKKNSLTTGIGLHLNKLGTQGPMSPGSFDKQKDKAVSNSHRRLIENPRTHSILGRSGTYLSSPDNNKSTQAVPEASTYLPSSSSMKGQDYSLDFTHLQPEKTPYSEGSSLVANCEIQENKNTSPRKKRPSEGEYKSCFCKRSKCLKLYCECFAAGNYCSDDCSCTNCFNKPDYEDTVLDSKQQIVQRNPLAFVPRHLIYYPDPTPNISEEAQIVLAPVMPRRGCNCKKSRCLKKYCDCYQVGVGCSEACRCEDCKNPNGANLVAAATSRPEDHFDGNLNIAHNMKGSTNTHKPIFIHGQPLSSQFVPLNQEFNTQGSYHVSPIWGNLVECPQSPLAHCSSGLMASSSNMPIAQENLQPAEAQFWQQRERLSFDPCSSSVTLPQSSTSANLYELFYNNSPFNLSANHDTTEGRKNTSPQKKYISAPNQPAQVLGSSSSTGQKRGRKYILQAVPSHPLPSPPNDLSNGVNQ